MTSLEAEQWLHSLPHRTRMPGVDSARALLALLDNPQQRLKFVHIAGTNGKGSTAAMLAAILKESGLRVGCNVSPYVVEFRERFQMNGEMIDPAALGAVTAVVRRAAEQLRRDTGEWPCEFAAVTAVALVWFAQQQCDIVVLETGIGGRLDATNAIPAPEVACILRIGMDHMDMLGYTIPEIAREKCGIIKPGCTVVSYPGQLEAAREVIAETAAAAGCELVEPDADDILPQKGRPLENRFDYGGYLADLALPGSHQQRNAAVAIEAALALWRRGWEIDDDAILRGLRAARMPARIEVVSRDPFVVIDGCHNPDGAAALASTLKKAKLTGLAGVMGMMEDKNCEETLRALEGCFAHLYTVTPQTAGPRALDTEQLAELARGVFPRVTVCDTAADALELAAEDGYEGAVVCGSLYLASEARALFGKE